MMRHYFFRKLDMKRGCATYGVIDTRVNDSNLDAFAKELHRFMDLLHTSKIVAEEPKEREKERERERDRGTRQEIGSYIS